MQHLCHLNGRVLPKRLWQVSMSLQHVKTLLSWYAPTHLMSVRFSYCHSFHISWTEMHCVNLLRGFVRTIPWHGTCVIPCISAHLANLVRCFVSATAFIAVELTCTNSNLFSGRGTIAYHITCAFVCTALPHVRISFSDTFYITC
jgi:hypothetical protein